MALTPAVSGVLFGSQRMALQVAILGSVEPRMDGDVVAVPPGKQRALLTLLAIRSPHPVSAESAAESLWPRAAPAEAAAQPAGDRVAAAALARQRRRRARDGDVGISPGGRARCDRCPTVRDAHRSRARGARVEGDPATARRLLDDALELWRGPALADDGVRVLRAGEIARLEELRVTAQEERIDARLSGGESTRSSSPSSSSWPPSIRRASGWSACSCWRCIAAVARPTRWRSTRGTDDGWTRSSDSSPRRSCGASQEAILRQDPSLDGPRRADRARAARRRAIAPGPAPASARDCRSWDAPRSWAGSPRCPTGRAPMGGRSRWWAASRAAARRGWRGSSPSTSRPSGVHVLYGACDPAVRTPYQPLVEALEPALAALPRARAGADATRRR